MRGRHYQKQAESYTIENNSVRFGNMGTDGTFT
jgi:hypothetical protein